MSKLDFLLNTTTIDCNNLEWFYAAQTNPAYSIIRLCVWRLHYFEGGGGPTQKFHYTAAVRIDITKLSTTESITKMRKTTARYSNYPDRIIRQRSLNCDRIY